MAKAKPAKSNEADAPAPLPAAYTVVARRYRPQQLGELIGQEHVAQALTNALTSGRIAHAYLFTGARGTGKTSTARILAKCLNCEKGPTPKPCDTCGICKSIMTGDDVDVLEIDGASNNGVENIRELRQNVGFRPTLARFKVYIIDEVHMLSSGAFNALLKTLEEPPGHVKFILATTEVHKVPITILSRCQRYDFAHVPQRKIFEHLKTIVNKEGLKAEDDALHIIARRAAGSMRDSQSLLDQLLAFSDGALTAETIHSLLGSSGEERVAELAGLILEKDAAAALTRLQQDADRGLQPGELLDQLIDYWRGLMLLLTAGPSFADLPGTPTFQETMKAKAAGLSIDTVLAGLDILTTAKNRSRGGSHVGTLLEMTVIRLARLAELISMNDLMADVKSGGLMVISTATADIPSKKNGIEPLSTVNPATDLTAPPVVKINDANDLGRICVEAIGILKRDLIVPPKCSYAIIGPNSLAFRFGNVYTDAYERCNDARTTESLQAALKKATGAEWQVRFELLAASTEVANAPTPESGPANPAAKPTAASPTRVTTSHQELLKLPMFARAAEVLGATLVKFDEEFSPTGDDTGEADDDAAPPSDPELE
jgi:DNA polymerase-3 subunit gamma/tau